MQVVQMLTERVREGKDKEKERERRLSCDCHVIHYYVTYRTRVFIGKSNIWQIYL